MGPKDLAQVLLPLKKYDHPDLIVGLAVSDDAAVYRLTPDLAIVQTVDFFPPVVDDPYLYGAIAAANAMSDVYAMGGEVLMGINIVAFPDDLPHEILSLILQGGADKMAEVGAIVAGGHTVIDKEPKYGICVTGKVHPNRIFTKGGAQTGDQLYLTKPLGTGIITTAHKRDLVDLADLKIATDSMCKLNQKAAQLLGKLQPQTLHACTDITGFGILGHASEMADHSQNIDLVINNASLPILPNVLAYISKGCVPGGAGRNRLYLEDPAHPRIRFEATINFELENLLFDPQTSGGLFFAVPTSEATHLEQLFKEASQALWQVGHVQNGTGLVLIQ